MINLDFHTAGLLFVTLLSLIAAGHILAAALIGLYICRPDPTSSSDQADDSKLFELQTPPPVELHRRDQK